MIYLRTLVVLLFFFFILSGNVFSQDVKKYATKRIEGEPPRIDGLLDDAAWEQVSWDNEFTQFQPHNGAQPSQQTQFKILYDNDYIYVGIKALDDSPKEIVNRLARRDSFQGDWVEIAFDSYHDYNTAYSFSATVAGVKNDEIYSGDNFHTDKTWDPIWFLKTSIDSEGWIAEIKIPFTQLRFSDETNQIWGLQVKRFVYRKEERSLWQPISNEQSGYVSRFGELTGLKNIKPKRQADLTPYTVVSYESFEAESGNPFTDGTEFNGRIGLDAKIGISNNLTLDLTINPDFGQVEADPSEVNLTAFESYFEEKRLFFIEGRSIYNFPLRLGNGNDAADNLFYSRRIGKRTSYFPDEYSYIDMPENTSILGAAKITGKTKNGFSVGILESVTNKEFLQTSDENGNIEKYTTEPLTNYFVSRVEKEYNQGATKIGGMFTATNRKIEESYLDILPTAAYTGGFNFDHSWDNRKYNFSVKIMGSTIQGSENAISDLQTSSSRYFQRPDANHLDFNPNLTSLSGHAGYAWFGKLSNSGWNYIAWFSWQSPGFELNDLGFLRSADDLTQILWGEYKFPKPFGIFRRLGVEGSQSTSFDYSGKYLASNADFSLRGQLNNYWNFSIGSYVSSKSLEKTLLRGGPLFLSPPGYNVFASLSTDRRKKLSFNSFVSAFTGAENFKSRQNYSLGLSYRPLEHILINFHPRLSFNNNQLQYIDVLQISGQDKYFLAELEQKTFVAQLRVDYSLSPDFSIQFYGQPFISSGQYSNFKYVTNPVENQYSNRFKIIQPDVDYGVDLDNDGNTDGYLYNPDFKYLQFQSNLVARWEYSPGSTLYLVWSQNKTDYPESYAFDFTTDFEDMFSIFPHNVFLLKFSYRIPI